MTGKLQLSRMSIVAQLAQMDARTPLIVAALLRSDKNNLPPSSSSISEQNLIKPNIK